MPYLSLVVLPVEKVCVPGQVDHGSDVVLGLVNDGQVQQPAGREGVNERRTRGTHQSSRHSQPIPWNENEWTVTQDPELPPIYSAAAVFREQRDISL